jgi:hypothetical protein
MKNINIRVPDELKTLVESRATERQQSVTEFVAECLNKSVDKSVISVGLPPTIFEAVNRAAGEHGMTADTFVECILRIYFQEPRSVWKPTPSTYENRLSLAGHQVFDTGRGLVQELARRAKEGVPQKICATVPKALHMHMQKDLNIYSSWRSLYRHIFSAMSQSKYIFVQRLVIQRHDSPADELKVPPELCDRFATRCVEVDKIMGDPLTESDRYYLNDFNIYGDLAVIFTDETSYGLPLTAIRSRAEQDIVFWQNCFDNLWDSADHQGK